MREKWARRIALLSGGLVLALAVIFALSQNSPDRAPAAPGTPAAAPIAPADAALVESGRRVYAEQDCARCHAIAGRGNPRSPLDGVGARLSAAELRRWIAPSREPAALSDSFQARHANRVLTEPQQEALLAYLRNLR